MSLRETIRIIRESERLRWQHLRRLGRARFILIAGVLRVGLPVFLLGIFISSSPKLPRSVGDVLAGALVCSIGGFTVGWNLWKRSGETPKDHAESAYHPLV